MTTQNWTRLLHFLRAAKCHLFLRAINTHLQIIVNDHTEPELDDHEPRHNQVKPETPTTTTTAFPDNLSLKPDQSPLTLQALNDCINVIKSQPSRINAACCYYLDDPAACITSSTISPDTSLVAFTNENSSLYLYRLSESTPPLLPEPSSSAAPFQELLGAHSNAVFKSEFTHDSRYLLSCGADNIACLWDVNANGSQQANQVCAYSGHLYPVWDLGVFSRLNLFSTASKDSTARLWSFDRLYPLRVYCGHQSDVNCVRFHPNGAYLATGMRTQSILCNWETRHIGGSL